VDLHILIVFGIDSLFARIELPKKRTTSLSSMCHPQTMIIATLNEKPYHHRSLSHLDPRVNQIWFQVTFGQQNPIRQSKLMFATDQSVSQLLLGFFRICDDT